MEERRITSLVVTSHEQRALGILHLHDLWGLELI
jgi:arabinose-5-phosphate isomerase